MHFVCSDADSAIIILSYYNLTDADGNLITYNNNIIFRCD